MDDEITQLAERIETDTKLDKLPDLRALIVATPAVRRLYFAAAVRCLGARRFYFDKTSKQMEFEPDGTAIMRAVAWLSGYDAGLPVQTTLNVDLGKSVKEMALEEAIAQSPALGVALERALQGARKRMPKQAALDVG